MFSQTSTSHLHRRLNVRGRSDGQAHAREVGEVDAVVRGQLLLEHFRVWDTLKLSVINLVQSANCNCVSLDLDMGGTVFKSLVKQT